MRQPNNTDHHVSFDRFQLFLYINTHTKHNKKKSQPESFVLCNSVDKNEERKKEKIIIENNKMVRKCLSECLRNIVQSEFIYYTTLNQPLLICLLSWRCGCALLRLTMRYYGVGVGSRGLLFFNDALLADGFYFHCLMIHFRRPLLSLTHADMSTQRWNK